MDFGGSFFSCVLSLSKTLSKLYHRLYSCVLPDYFYKEVNNIFQLIYFSSFFSVSCFLIYHMPIVVWFTYYSPSGILITLIRIIVSSIISVIIALSADAIESFVNSTMNMFYHNFYFFVWVISLILYLITFDNDILQFE